MWADVRAALSVELIKARRSWVARVSLAAMLLAGAVDAFFLFVVQDPDRARRFGRLPEFRALAARLDPGGTFRNRWLEERVL